MRSTSPLPRLLVTLLLLATAVSLSWLPLPGVDPAAYAELASRAGSPSNAGHSPWLSWTPFLSAFLAVELLSFVIPPLRAMRRHGAVGRAKLTRLGVAGGVVVAVVQSCAVARFLAGVVTPLGRPLLPPGLAPALALVASLVGSSVACFLLARWISLYGFGDGFVGLAVADLVVPIAGEIAAAQDRSTYDVGLLACGLLFLAIAAYLSRGATLPIVTARGEERTLSYPPFPSGLVALSGAIVIYRSASPPPVTGWAVVAVLVALVLVLGFPSAAIFASPRRVSRSLAPLVSLAPGVSTAGLVARNLLLLSALVAVGPAIELWSDSYRYLPLDVAALLTLAAVAVDGRAEWAFRSAHGPLVRLQDLDNVYFAAYLQLAAAEAGRPLLIQSFQLRRLFFFLGPLYKMTVLAPRRDAEEARAWLASLAVETV